MKQLLPVDLLKKLASSAETFVFGGRLREATLTFLLKQLFESQYRRSWFWSAEKPHFFNHRWSVLKMLTGDAISPFAFARAFYAAEIVRGGDKILDIGCGDGFLTRTFYAPDCSAVDAVDCDPDALAEANRYNAHPRITYHLLDATRDSFPNPPYDVIVWDGAIGHFPAESITRMIEKVRESLAQDGVFVGSESLGAEGHDHLCFFETLDDLRKMFTPHFEFTRLRELQYHIPAGLHRREGYWRCAGSPARLEASSWR